MKPLVKEKLVFRKEVKNMKNIREFGRNVLMISGLLTAGVSLGDGLVASATDKEHQAFMSTRAELQEKYRVQTDCVSGGQPFTTYCSDYIPGMNESDESRVLRMYHEELSRRVSAIPQDAAHRRREHRDVVGFLGGAAMVELAARLKRKKE